MSSSKDVTEELMKMNLYEMLGIEQTAGEKAIKKAYRKEALKCHPDKNPDDPKAAELFMKLSKILEILCDTDARKTYDRLLKARAATQLRSKEFDSKRRKLKDELEAREKAAEASKDNIQRDMAKLQVEIERLRKQGSKQLEEEQKLMQEQLKKEKEGICVPDHDDGDGCRLKIRWKCPDSDDDYDHDTLSALFSKYGDISAIVISRKKKGSALIEFTDRNAAMMASEQEKGNIRIPLTIEVISNHQSAQRAPPAKSSSSMPPLSQSGFDTFESLVLRNLRQAQERQRLKEELKNEDE